MARKTSNGTQVASPWKEIELKDGAAHAAHRCWIHRDTLASIFLLWEAEVGWWFDLRHQGRAEKLANAGKPDDPQPRAWADLFTDAERRLSTWADSGK